MEERHLSELELLELVEGELGPAEAAAAGRHVQACAACRAQRDDLVRARDALRAAPLLELPRARLAAVLGSLPPQEREPRGVRAFFASPLRIALVAVPAAVAAVAVVVSLSVGDGGGGTSAAAPKTAAALAARDSASPGASGGGAEAGGAAAETAAGARTAAEGGAAAAATAAAAPLRVAGPPAEVARELRAAGLTAIVSGGVVEVRGASRERVELVLARRGPGDVEVVLSGP